jgi:acyl dehydratase
MSEASGVKIGVAELPGLAETHLGYTDRQEMTQDRVNQFADVTDDHRPRSRQVPGAAAGRIRVSGRR